MSYYQCHTTNYSPKKIIYKWILETVADGSWQNYNDLHIDVIDELHNRNRKNWIEASIKYYMIARKFLLEKKIPFDIELYIELECKNGNNNSPVKTYHELLKELTDTPPSLYLWSKQVPIVPSGMPIITQPLAGFLKLPTSITQSYSQYYDPESDETNRYITLK